MAEVVFDYEGGKTFIQCQVNDKMKNIIDSFLTKKNETDNNNLLYYLYNGTNINKQLTFYEQANEFDKVRKKMNIIVNKTDEIVDQANKIISKDVICPLCKENALIDLRNLKINLFGCRNNHNINNIPLSRYEEIQQIDLSQIVCNNFGCRNNKNNTYNNDFYKCITCFKNLCPLCKSNHDKNHKIINYDDKNYICNIHNDSYIKYCQTCKKDLCFLCENFHNPAQPHNIFDYKQILINEVAISGTMKNLRNVINKLKFKINIIKEILDRLINMADLYYKINTFIIGNYNPNKRNFHILQNIFNLNNYNNFLINYFSNIINNDTIFQIYKFPNEIFSKVNDEIYIVEMKNNQFDGKGLCYYKENDELNRVKYDGNWKNNIRDGKGVINWKNGNRYEGDFKYDRMEGKGIFYYINGDRYEGDFKYDRIEGWGIMYYDNGDRYEGTWKNYMREGKGIMFYKNGNRYEGDFKNDKKEGKGIVYFKNGNMYKGDFKNDKKEGWGIFHWKEGDKYEGYFKNDEKEGKGVFYWNDGDRYEGYFKNDLREGTGKMYYKDGTVKKGFWKKDKLI